jgi:pimeloyl-ACP methyl ester carboxylesterase
MNVAARPRIAYDSVGQGDPAFLFLPGWCVNRSFFGPVLEPASRKRRALSLDWRGHGGSERPGEDYTTEDLVADALQVIDDAGIDRVIPVAQAHAGWMALELRRRLGPERVPGLVLMSWMVLGPPPEFGEALAGLRDPGRWEAVRDGLLTRWTGVSDDPAIHRQAEEMRAYGFDTWARAGREIGASFEREGTPLAALERLDPPARVLHIYAQPADESFLSAQQAYAADRHWFRVKRVEGSTHFPTLEAPDAVADALEAFASEVASVVASR